MGIIYDRLYGQLTFPRIIKDLLDCPGILRLRHIGMANVDFFAFPSFASVTRYEHSLGVCHLAKLAARSLKLSESETYEIMLAALYHDVTTPPFAHAFEEYLKDRFNFDHEKRFYELLAGTSPDIGKTHTQIFNGRELKLLKYAKGTHFRKHKINLYRIPRLVFGDKTDPLANLISGDIDLDNIDNVIRASAAMGIRESNGLLAERLSSSFVFSGSSGIGISFDNKPSVEKWMKLRSSLYDMIFCSIDDFALQTMLKYCLRLLANCDNSDYRLTEDNWKLTESELIAKMRELPESNAILKRIDLKELFSCVGLLWLKGPGALKYVMNEDNRIVLENIGHDLFELKITSNYYIDKRFRALKRSLVFFNQDYSINGHSRDEESVLLGFFSHQGMRSHIKIDGKKLGMSARVQVEEFLKRILELIPPGINIFLPKSRSKNGYPHLSEGEQIR